MVFKQSEHATRLTMFLPDEEFKKIIQGSPLISIDLLVRNEYNEYLLGKRLNEPAKNYWFVPGGRIQKNETISQAIDRISVNELSIHLKLEQGRFHGVWQHFYHNNFFNDEFTTHYIVLAYIFNAERESIHPPQTQHQRFRWLRKEEILIDSTVHKYSASYFSDND
ncbi:GDP-mannose mannosyl hydrolase, partial [Escherichia coli]|nr:GDP-mannose mannosyl hydrolase [Escherichia coli]